VPIPVMPSTTGSPIAPEESASVAQPIEEQTVNP
jgi:hypothetical protein